jgi:hypothetical protein
MLAIGIAGILSIAALAPKATGQPINREALSRAIAEIESSNGKNIGPRYEPGFYQKYKKKGMMPDLIMRFGKKPAASSYGKYQIMLVVAWEYGFKFTPDELADEVNNTKVHNAIVDRIISKTGDDEGFIEKIGQRYNGSVAYGKKLKETYLRFSQE